jgi:hypothetical protein
VLQLLLLRVVQVHRAEAALHGGRRSPGARHCCRAGGAAGDARLAAEPRHTAAAALDGAEAGRQRGDELWQVRLQQSIEAVLLCRAQQLVVHRVAVVDALALL